jgi:membrane-associated phospholipid phosphatase
VDELSHRILTIWRQQVGGRLLPLLFTVRGLGLLMAALALWGFYHIAEEVLEQETLALDTNILLTLKQWHNPWLDRLMLSLTALGEPFLLLIASIILASFLLWRGYRAEMTALVIAAVGALVLNVLLKNLFARHRPELWQRAVEVQFYSFPSGHAMMSFVVYGMVGYLLAQHFKGWRIQIAALTVLLIGTIGLSRLYLGVHWPTDVIAGYAAGTVWLMTCILSLRIWKQRLRPQVAGSSEGAAENPPE